MKKLEEIEVEFDLIENKFRLNSEEVKLDPLGKDKKVVYYFGELRGQPHIRDTLQIFLLYQRPYNRKRIINHNKRSNKPHLDLYKAASQDFRTIKEIISKQKLQDRFNFDCYESEGKVLALSDPYIVCDWIMKLKLKKPCKISIKS